MGRKRADVALTPQMARSGRPSVYSEETALEICSLIAEGLTLSEICRRDGMPCRATVNLWVVDNLHGFSDRYARARQVQWDVWADEINEIADDATNDYMDRQSQSGITKVVDAEHVNRSRLRIDSRKWLLSKLKPKVYGDQIQLAGIEDAPPVNLQINFVKPKNDAS